MSFKTPVVARFRRVSCLYAAILFLNCALEASGQCHYDLNGVGYNYGSGDPAACPYRGPANRSTTVPAAGTDGYAQLGTALGNALVLVVTRGLSELLNHKQHAQDALNAANARVANAVAAENAARARNDAEATARAMAAADAAREEAAAAAERERAATAAYISERNKLTAHMMGDQSSAPRTLMGDDSGAPRALMGDDGASQSHAADQLAGMVLGFGGGNAACIADGRPECLAPVVRLQVRPNHPAIPEDTAAFEAGLPQGALTKPKLQPWLDQLDRQSVQRADLHDKAAAAEQAALAAPEDPAKKRDATVLGGQLTGQQGDEDKTKDRIKKLVDFDGPGAIQLGGNAPNSSGGTGPQ